MLMRLLLACISLFLAPIGGLLFTERYVTSFEDEFLFDASRQVARLDSLLNFYPPAAKKLRAAPAILQLKGLTEGARVAETVCGPADLPYRRLFDHLKTRCDRWTLYRRARRFALLATVLTFGVFALVLMARITVRRYANRQEWPANWTLWFVVRGVPLLLLAHVAVSFAGYAVVLHTLTARAWATAAILAAPFLLLLWLEKRLVVAFVEPHTLAAYRPRGVEGPRRQSRFATR